MPIGFFLPATFIALSLEKTLTLKVYDWVLSGHKKSPPKLGGL